MTVKTSAQILTQPETTPRPIRRRTLWTNEPMQRNLSSGNVGARETNSQKSESKVRSDISPSDRSPTRQKTRQKTTQRKTDHAQTQQTTRHENTRKGENGQRTQRERTPWGPSARAREWGPKTSLAFLVLRRARHTFSQVFST
jgi:hypothetical protein